MHEAIAPAYPEPPRHRRFVLVLLLSIALHSVLLWWAGDPLRYRKTATGPDEPRTLHLTFYPIQQMESETETPLNRSDSSSADHASGMEKESGERSTSEQMEVPPSPTKNSVRDRTSSSAILAAARELARKMALKDDSETKSSHGSVASALARALNPQTETPGVKALADGTIRVVTEYGLVYCIRPNEDWRILGPADNLPVSMICR